MTSKLDYLKKYMDDGGKSKGKRKKKKIKPLHNIKIIDSQACFGNANDDDDNNEFDLMEEKPMLYAEDGTTILTKEYEEKEMKKKLSWKSVDKNDGVNKDTQNGNGRKRHDSSGSDLSPVRESGARSRHRKRHDSNNSDLSPTRGRASDGSDISRKRRTRHDSSASSDLSPERPVNNERNSRKNSDSDLSPERSNTVKEGSSKRRREEKPEVVSTGKKAGLQSASELKIENELRRENEREKFSNLDPSISGKGAETTHRDRKSGRKIDVKLEELQKKKAEEEKAKDVEKYATWGRGVVQENEHKKKIEDALHEMDKPLARYKGDKDLEALLKEQNREGDPMLAYLTKKKAQAKSKVPSKPKYNGPKPNPNRFNIWPGYRYDGVDRSNGFEKKRFAAINEKKTFNEAKHKWSVEDM